MNSLKFATGMLLVTAPFGAVIVFSMVVAGPLATLGIVGGTALIGACIWGGVTMVDSATRAQERRRG